MFGREGGGEEISRSWCIDWGVFNEVIWVGRCRLPDYESRDSGGFGNNFEGAVGVVELWGWLLLFENGCLIDSFPAYLSYQYEVDVKN
jgi:hypothetical protein